MPIITRRAATAGAWVWCAISVWPVTPSLASQTRDGDQAAARAIIQLFDSVPVVALGETHWIQDERDFEVALVRTPGFAGTVNDIVMECGNARYQDILDRYVAGKDVPYTQVQQVWRNTTQTGRCDTPDRAALITAVRDVNRHLPAAQRMRVLAGDPPIDWGKVQSPADVQPYMERDQHFATVVEREVLAKHRKALLQVGSGHILKRPVSWGDQPGPGSPANPTVTMLIERHYPGSVFVIMAHSGFGPQTAALEPRLAGRTPPALIRLTREWPGDLDAGVIFTGQIMRVGQNPDKPENPYPGSRLRDLADGYLYFGPMASLTHVPDPVYAAADSLYLKELARRRAFESGPVRVPAPAPRVPG